MFKLPTIATVTFSTALANFVIASVWGISLGYAYRWLDERAKNEEVVLEPKARFNPLLSPARKVIVRKNKE